jgi:hypothetical protein
LVDGGARKAVTFVICAAVMGLGVVAAVAVPGRHRAIAPASTAAPAID